MHMNCFIIDDEEALAQATSEYFNLFDVKTTYVTYKEDAITFLKKIRLM